MIFFFSSFDSEIMVELAQIDNNYKKRKQRLTITFVLLSQRCLSLRF